MVNKVQRFSENKVAAKQLSSLSDKKESLNRASHLSDNCYEDKTNSNK